MEPRGLRSAASLQRGEEASGDIFCEAHFYAALFCPGLYLSAMVFFLVCKCVCVCGDEGGMDSYVCARTRVV